MLRVASFNINGIRATHRRGFGDWLEQRDCDVVALQEVRCPVDALPVGAFRGYHASYDPGSLPGRNGVAILTRTRPVAVRTWNGAAYSVEAQHLWTDQPTATELQTESVPLARELRPFAMEGRYIEVDLADRPVTVASLYLPKGGLPSDLQRPGRMREKPDGGARYARKMSFVKGFQRQLGASRRAALRSGREFLLVGDLNIAHGPLDVANWRRQQRSEGFLPQERAWFDQQLGPRRLIDVMRQLDPDVQGPYTWWSWLGRAFENDTGWRIDYHLATPTLAHSAVTAVVERETHRAARRSDHAAVVVDYDLR
ncbi:exodeoxyribonuclease III [Rudaeicoccus suwonensis]|uniref:Exodeoxyribonuclease-3 n=1 Tax=Rudaeicoccus suwonensis TaxID=657409 RepID=A0A561E407_9MICO|nr:exodeoxyribonuclease III [Rudaeicoccus suwonensis]TWE10338.1 exodeoxyribonuclease-3 [Rudaeicoccus suwonensis]